MTCDSSSDGLYFYTPNNNNWLFTGTTADIGRQSVRLTPTTITMSDTIIGSAPDFTLSLGGATIKGNPSSFLCSDLSSTCLAFPIAPGNTPGTGSGVQMDNTGRINTGGIKQKNAKLAVGGSALIGTGYSDIGAMPTNGIKVMGEVITSSLTVSAAASTAYEAAFSTTTTFNHVLISTSGHFITGGQSPTISSCGSTPNGSVVGDDNRGTITIGGGSVTSCTLTFANTWGAIPVCVITDNSTTIPGDISSISATAFTTSFNLSLGGGTVWYQCGCSGSSCR